MFNILDINLLGTENIKGPPPVNGIMMKMKDHMNCVYIVLVSKNFMIFL
jgi:hypothetical protein